jgi:hypothetical protein
MLRADPSGWQLDTRTDGNEIRIELLEVVSGVSKEGDAQA